MSDKSGYDKSIFLKSVRNAIIIIIPVILVITSLSGDHNYGLLSIFMIVIAMVPFFLRFERRKPEARELVVIAVMASLAVLGRVAFASFSNFTPTTAIIIITALTFGPEAGFLTGAITAVASNLFFGQGPWTPWQMFCWGMAGFGAGMLGKGRLDSILIFSIYGFFAGFVYGWVMNIWFIIAFVQPINWQTIIAAYIASFWFDFTHGLSTLIFLLVLAKPWLRKLNRIKIKYGLLEMN